MLLVGLAGVVALLAWRRNELVAPLALRIAHGPLERATGLDVEVGRFAGSWVRGIELEGVRARATDPDAPLRRLAAERVAVRWRLARLVRGDLAGLTDVEARDVGLELDLTRGGAAPPVDGADGDGGGGLRLPEVLPRVALAGVDLAVRIDATTAIEIRGLAVDAGGAPVLELDARALELALHAAGTRRTVERPALTGRLEKDRFALTLDLLSRSLGVEGTLSRAADEGSRVAATLRLRDADVERDARLAFALAGVAHDERAWSGTVSATVEVDLPLAGPLDGMARATFSGTGLVLGGLVLDRLDASARLADRRVVDGRVEATRGANRVTVSGLETPLAAPDLAARLAATRAEVAAELEDVPALIATFADDGADDGAELGEHRVTLDARLADGVLTIDDGTLDYAGGHADVRRGAVPLAVRDDGIAADALDVELDVELRDVAALGALVEQDGWRGSLVGELVVQGTPGAPRGRARLTGRDLAFGDVALGALELRADADGERVVVEELALDGPLARLAAEGRFDLATRRVRRAHATGTTGPGLAERWPAVEGLAGGPLAFEVLLEPAAEAPDVPDGSFALDAAWSAPALEGSLAGVIPPFTDRWSVRLDEGSFTFGGADGDAFTLERPVSIDVAPDGVEVRDLSLASRAGGTLRASFAEREGGHLSVDAELAAFAPPAALTGRLPTGFVVGPISGTVQVLRADGELTGLVDLEPIDLALEGFPEARVTLAAAAADGRVEIERIALDGAGFALELAGGLPFDPAHPSVLPDGPLALRGDLRVDDLDPFAAPLPTPDGVRVEGGSVSARIAIKGTSAAPRGGVAFDLRDLSLVLGEHELARRFGAALAADVVLAEDAVQVSSGTIALDGDSVRGTFEGSLALPLDLTAIGQGTWQAAGAPLDARVALDVRDLAALAPLSDVVRRLSGEARLDVEVSGTPAEPVPRGTLRVRDGALRTSTALPAIAALDAEVALDRDGIDVTGVTGELGGAPFRLDGSLVPWGAEPSIALSFSGEDLLLYRLDGVRVRADGELALSGALAAPLVSGTIALRDGRYVKNFDILPRDGLRGGPKRPGRAQRGLQLFSLGPPLAAWTFDLRVRSATPFEIDNNLTKGALRPELTLKGTGAVPIPDGTIYLDPTRVSLPSGTLWVRSGTVVFDDANPFLPKLEIQAEMRLYGYDITLAIEGPYDRPEITLSSVPALSDEKLLLMVLTGAQPDEDGEVNATAQDVALYLAKDFLDKLTGDSATADDESLLDRVEVVIGGDVTRSGSQTTRGSLRVADDVLREDDQLFLTAEKDVYDKINFGVRILFRFP